MSEAGDGRAIAGWLRRFRWALGAVPSPERDDILAETRAHIDERVAGGFSVTDALNAFGTPEGYARSFVEEMELARALTSESSLLAAVARRAHRSAVAAGAFLVVLILAALATGVIVTALLKLGSPSEYGLWAGPGFLFFGALDGAEGGRELLGGWIYPVAPLIAGLAWMLGRLALLGAVRRLKRAR